ncbi:MAG: lnt [Caulobacteraceae bacterium]|nr:lnt [Caulobacteraceae bacterium]
MIILLALLAGLSAGLAQPPYGLLAGVFGYGLVAHLVDRSDRQRPFRSAFWRGWMAGSAYFAISCWWVIEAFLIDIKTDGWWAAPAILALACGVGLFWGLGAMLYRMAAHGRDGKAGHLARAAVFAGCFTLTEWLRGHVLTGFPWALPGEVWRPGGPMSQGAALLGSYGMTWLTLFLVASLWQIRAGKRGIMAFGVGAAGTLALLTFGLVRLHEAPVRGTVAADAPLIRLVQPNIPQEAKYDEAAFNRNFDTYLRLTSRPAARQPQAVIWPEGALPYAFDDYLASGRWTSGRLAEVLQPGQTLLVGGYHFVGPRVFNSLAVVVRQGDGISHTVVYDKYRLVPFGEYLPAAPLLKRLGVAQLVPVGDGFSNGGPPRPVTVAGLPTMQPLICYEDIFPGFTRQGAKLAGRRAEWILVVSNDAWFGRGAGPRQHLDLASYRAIEEGLPLIRDTPTGVSAVIDSYGRTVLALEPGREGIIDASLPPALKPTFYARHGDLPLGAMILLSVLAMTTRVNKIARKQ